MSTARKSGNLPDACILNWLTDQARHPPPACPARAGLPVQQLRFSDAPSQTQPWAHSAPPPGQQDQQRFSREVHLETLQEQPVEQEEPRAFMVPVSS
ncbi:hypothetical protein CB1_001402132 [Camelus ferus]|nr:hypothetical protein CB1_001402132 [Camelus ferus]